MKHFLYIGIICILTPSVWAQPGPNWAEIINKNKPQMRANKVKETKVVNFELGKPSIYFHEFFNEEGQIYQTHDARFSETAHGIKVEWSRLEFDYSDDDSLRVVGFASTIPPLVVESVDSNNWREYVQEVPTEWKQEYEFFYGLDSSGYFKFEGKRIYNDDSLLWKIEHHHKGELVHQKINFYENRRMVRTENHKKTRMMGFKHDSETFITYTESGEPDSIYTIRYVNPLGDDDTAFVQKTKFDYDEEGRILRETLVQRKRIKSILFYDYSTIEDGYYRTVRTNASGVEESILRFTPTGLELGGALYNSFGKEKKRTKTEYVYFE